MKRSKIFLAGTACLLTFVGVAASRVHYGLFHGVYTAAFPGGPCVVPLSISGFTQPVPSSVQIGWSFNRGPCYVPLFDMGE